MTNFTQRVEDFKADIAQAGRNAAGEPVTPEAVQTYSISETEFHKIIDKWFKNAEPTVMYNAAQLRDWLVQLCLDVQSQTEARTLRNMLRSNLN